MKVSYVIGAYFGERNNVHPACKNDKLWYVEQHINQLKKQTKNIHKIYIVCTFDDFQDKKEILSNLHIRYDSDSKIIIKYREPNIGGCYFSWKTALHLDNGDSDYIVLIEDDYVLYDVDAIKLMMEYFSSDDLFYLCMHWTKIPLENFDYVVVEHAAVASGIINNKMYHKLRMELDMDFTVPSKINLVEVGQYTACCIAQLYLLEEYRKHGLKIRDMCDKYNVFFPHSWAPIQQFGKEDGKKLIVPIDREFENIKL